MVLFDIPFSLVIGGILGWQTRGERPELALTAVGLGLLPASMAFLAAWPDWDWQYLLDPATLPPGMPGVVAGAIVGAALLGHQLGHRKPRIIVAAAAFLALYLVWSTPRTLHVGDGAAWAAGTAEVLPTSFLLFAAPWFLFSGLVLGACLWAGERHRKKNQQSSND